MFGYRLGYKEVPYLYERQLTEATDNSLLECHKVKVFCKKLTLELLEFSFELPHWSGAAKRKLKGLSCLYASTLLSNTMSRGADSG